MNERRPRIVIAGTGSGAGKTTVTLGLLAALQHRGLRVQGFKCGPDYIDTAYHTAVTGRPSRNLDTWLLPESVLTELFLYSSQTADISIIEGVMGLYDGKDPLSNRGSTAEVAQLLACPVILVVNARSMARSAAAVVLGYQKLDERVAIVGVILNQCGSEHHYNIVKAAIEQECNVAVLGFLGRDEELRIPERHLGLLPAVERGELKSLFVRMQQAVERGIDLDRLLMLAEMASKLARPSPSFFRSAQVVSQGPIIAIAKDAAFNFYYEENLELLEQAGARLAFFSPLAGETVPAAASGLYLGGGFPEQFASQLAAQRQVMQAIRRLAEDGMPIFAECGGYMYLTRRLTTLDGSTHEMTGLVPARVAMQPKLAALGYREATALTNTPLLMQGETVRGHEFRYSTLVFDGEHNNWAYTTTSSRGRGRDGYACGSVMAGYMHLHFASNPRIAPRFVEQCRLYEHRRGGAL